MMCLRLTYQASKIFAVSTAAAYFFISIRMEIWAFSSGITILTALPKPIFQLVIAVHRDGLTNGDNHKELSIGHRQIHQLTGLALSGKAN